MEGGKPERPKYMVGIHNSRNSHSESKILVPGVSRILDLAPGVSRIRDLAPGVSRIHAKSTKSTKSTCDLLSAENLKLFFADVLVT